MRTHLALATAIAVSLAAPARAQQPPPAKPVTFDVVSVRPAVNTDNRRLAWTPGRFIATSAPFIGLVNMAYGGGAPVRLDGAGALGGSMWDVEATFDAALTPTPEQRAEMLRAMLEDRFRLPADADTLPSIFVAIREQLGLKLESTRAPVEYHVVERVQHPEPN